MKKILLFLMSVLMSFQLFAQVDIQIGSGTSSTTHPLPGYYGWHRSAMLYKADEINLSGTISAIAYDIKSASTGTTAKMKIYLVETTNSTMPAINTISWNALKTGATLVYENNALAAAPTGWKTFTFDTPFTYSGTSNLMVLIEGEGCSTTGGCSVSCAYHTADNMHWYHRKDSSAPDDSVPPANTTTDISKRSNIKLTITPPAGFCYPPSNLAASNITSSSADITWDTHTSGNWWIVQYKKNSETVWSDEAMVFSGSYSLANLDAQATYDVRVKSICSADESGWSTTSFMTACGAIAALPWTDSFDTYGTGTTVFPPCWTRTTTQTDRPYVSSTNFSAPGSLYFYAISGNYNIAATPMFDASIPVSTLHADFMYRTTLSTDTLFIGVMTDPTDASTFEQVAFVTNSSTSTWYEKEVSFDNYMGIGQYIAFKISNATATSYAYLDDVRIGLIPTCLKPTNVAVISAEMDQLEVGWVENGFATSWVVEYKKTTDATWQVETANINPYTIYNLDAETEYMIRVKADCGTEESYYSQSITAMTLCESIVNLPWTDSFDTYGTGSSVFPTCWTRNTTYANRPYVSTTNFSSPGSLYFYVSSGTYNIAATPKFDASIPINTLQAAFKYRTSSGTDTLFIGAMTNPLDTSTFELITYVTNSSTVTWHDKEVFLSSYQGNGQYIAFMIRCGSSTAVAYIDDLEISLIPSCPKPSDLAIVSIASDQLEVGWTENGTATSWIFEYKETAETTWQVENASTNPHTIYNLDPQTQYEVRVKANCGTEESNYSQTLTVTTPCTAITTLPWSEYFDTYGTGSGAFPPCWFRPVLYGTTPYPSIVTVNYSAPGSLRFQSATTQPTYAVTPQMDVDINTLMVTFQLRAENTISSGVMHVGVMSNPYDPSTFELVQIITPTSTSFQEYEVFFANTTLTGTGNFIAFKHVTNSASYYYWLDNVVVDLIPPCPKPSGLTVVSAETDQLEIGWLESGTATSWTFEYKNVADTAWIVEYVYNNPHTIYNLDPSTFYEIRIKSDCGTEDSEYSDVFTAMTACGAIETLPWSDSFDTYGTGTSVFPPCWTRNTTYADRPYVHGTTYYSAPGSLYFYTGTSGTYNIAATPEFDASIPINTLHATFMYRTYTATDTLFIGVMTDPTDASTFDEVAYLTNNSTGTWYAKEVFFANYTGTGQYIAFKIRYSSPNTYAYIDDLTVDLIPSCPSPTLLTLVNAETDELEVGWQENGTATSWIVEYKKASEEIWTEELAFTNPHTIQNLEASTTYMIRVKADCGFEESDYSSVLNAMTACGSISTLPWSDYFDTYGTGTSVFPPCWTRTSTQTDRPYVSSTYYISSPGSLYFYAGTGNYNIAATPEFDASIAINTLQAIFMYRTTYSTDTLFIGVMTDPTNASTFEQVTFVTNASTGTWYEKEVSFANYQGTGQYIAFMIRYNTSAAYAYIDNLDIDLYSSCARPTQIHLVSATTDELEIGWTENGTATSWIVEYKKVTDNVWEEETAYINPYTISNLDPQTDYMVRVKADCGTETSTLPQTIIASTACLPVGTFPWSESFDTYGTTAGTFPPCWYRPVLNTSTPYPSIVTVNNTPPGSLRFQSASASQPTYAITPQMDADINTLMITFQLRAESASSSGVMHVGVMSNPYDLTTFELVQIITPTNTSFQEYEVMFSNTTLTGTGNYIAFKHVTNSSAYYYWLDDVVVEFMPDCPRPTDLTVVSIASDQVEVGWTENGTATSWVVEYKEATATTWQVENAYANPHTIMNLNASTNYEIRVKADCGTEDSDYSVPLTVTTSCLAVDSFPYTENFDTYGTTTGTFPTCWFRPVLNTSTPYPSIVTAYSVSSPASLRFQSASATVPTYAITPQLDADINTLMVTFQLKAESVTNSGVMHVGVMSNPYDLTTFELVQIITPTGTSFEEHEVMFSNTTLTGTGNYIAFKHVTNSSIYYYWLDDVVVDLIPSCPRPADLTSSNVTQTSLDLGWVEYGTATAWEVEYGATGFTQGTGTILAVATNPVSITGLTESTCYDFYVRSVCAPGDESDWSNMATFCTSQTPVNVPFTIDFETASGFTFANNTSGNNWHVGNAADVNNTTGGSNGLYISNDNGVTNAYSNTSCVVWAFRDIYFTPSTDDYTLTFDWKCRGESSFDYFNVYIGVPVMPVASTSSTIIAPAGATTLGTILNQQTTWQSETYTLSATTYSGQTMRLYFGWRNDSSVSNQPPAAIDNIEITGPEVCLPPTNLAISNISATGATATWGGTAASWVFEYKTAAATTWTTQAVTTATYTMTGLQPSTAYETRVKAICDDGEVSDYSSVVSFTTSATPCVTPTNLQVTNITDQSALATWTAGGTETSWQVDYKLVSSSNWTTGTATTTSFAMTGLQSNSNYHVRVKAICTTGESAFTEPVPFTTAGTTTYTITATAGPHGTITPSGDVTVNEGGSQTFTFTPEAGYRIDVVLVDNVPQVPVPESYTFENIQANHTIHVDFAEGIAENELSQYVTLYPNPTQSLIDLKLDRDYLGTTECRIYDMYGKLMRIMPIEEEITTIDVSDFATGVYFVRLTTEQGQVSKRFVKK